MSGYACLVLVQAVCWTGHVLVRMGGPVRNVILSVKGGSKAHVAGMALADQMENASVKGAGPEEIVVSNVRVPKKIPITGPAITTVIAMDGSSTLEHSCIWAQRTRTKSRTNQWDKAYGFMRSAPTSHKMDHVRVTTGTGQIGVRLTAL